MRIKIVLIFCIMGFISACGEISFDLLDEEKKSLSEFKGQWLFINYWAAWCKPCIKEIPELNAFNTRSGVEVLAFNYDNLDEANLKSQIKQFGIQYRSLIQDPAVLFDQAVPTGLPATMVINTEGKFVDWLYGAQNEESLLDVLKSTSL